LKRGGQNERVPLSDQLPRFNLNGPEYIDFDRPR
jgi:hypothetical protein